MVKIHPVIKWRWEGDRVFLNTLTTLNKTAGEVLEFIEEGHSPKEIVTLMQKKYPEVAPSKISTDVQRILKQFENWQLIVPDDADEKSLSKRLPISSKAVEHLRKYFNNELSAPMRVSLNITMECQAHCLHCYASSPRPLPNELTTAELKALIDEIVAMGVFNITFSGGEPTLRKDLEELISYTADQSLKPVLITNGALLDKKMIERLTAAGLLGIQISLDGATAEVHDHFRGLPGLFDHLMEVIPEIVESPIELQVAYTITKANMHHVTRVMELAEKMHMGRLAIMNVLNTGRMKEHAEYLPTLDDYACILKQMVEKEKELDNTYIFYPEVPSAIFKEVLGEQSYLNLISAGKIGPCVAGITQCAVNPDGSVIPCDASMGISVGNVREQNLAEIWRTSPVLKHLRAVSKKEQDPCKKCPEQNICIAGCNALPWQLENEEYRFTADIMCSQCFSQFQG